MLGAQDRGEILEAYASGEVGAWAVACAMLSHEPERTEQVHKLTVRITDRFAALVRARGGDPERLSESEEAELLTLLDAACEPIVVRVIAAWSESSKRGGAA